MDHNHTAAVHPGALKSSLRGFRRDAPHTLSPAMAAFAMPAAPAPNNEDLHTLTAALNRMSVHNALPPGGESA